MRNYLDESLPIDFRAAYTRFDTPITTIDCGVKCAPYNPHGKPFCCDICEAVPAVYRQEWEYLRNSTDLWHEWRGDECPNPVENRAELLSETPDNMLLLACQGPAACQRDFRAISCRQFPFFPYFTSDLRLVGLAYEWEYEGVCWVISNLSLVTDRFRESFIEFYDFLFEKWPLEIRAYAIKSEELREHFIKTRRRIALLHRNGGYYLISPQPERMHKVQKEQLPRFHPYRQADV